MLSVGCAVQGDGDERRGWVLMLGFGAVTGRWVSGRTRR
jgi:MYXO-CTERM domain-containing protein